MKISKFITNKLAKLDWPHYEQNSPKEEMRDHTRHGSWLFRAIKLGQDSIPSLYIGNGVSKDIKAKYV